jgi:hypothetical protein
VLQVVDGGIAMNIPLGSYVAYEDPSDDEYHALRARKIRKTKLWAIAVVLVQLDLVGVF